MGVDDQQVMADYMKNLDTKAEDLTSDMNDENSVNYLPKVINNV